MKIGPPAYGRRGGGTLPVGGAPVAGVAVAGVATVPSFSSDTSPSSTRFFSRALVDVHRSSTSKAKRLHRKRDAIKEAERHTRKFLMLPRGKLAKPQPDFQACFNVNGDGCALLDNGAAQDARRELPAARRQRRTPRCSRFAARASPPVAVSDAASGGPDAHPLVPGRPARRLRHRAHLVRVCLCSWPPPPPPPPPSPRGHER